MLALQLSRVRLSRCPLRHSYFFAGRTLIFSGRAPPARALQGRLNTLLSDNQKLLPSSNRITMPDGYQLPVGCTVVRLQDEPDLDRRAALMEQVHELIRDNYGSYADSEPPAVWLANMARSGLDPEGFKLLVSAVLDAEGKVLAFSSAEVLPCGQNRYIYNAYTCISHGAARAPIHLALIYAVKKDAALAAVALRDELAKKGCHVQGSFQDHQLHNPGHAPKIRVGFSLGQMPLGALGFATYQLPVYSSEVAGSDGAADAELLEQKKAAGTRADLFMADFPPSNPSMPFATILKEFAHGYVTSHSVYAPTLTDDPSYRAMCSFADILSQASSYEAVYEEASIKAATFLDLDPKLQGRGPAYVNQYSGESNAAELAEFFQHAYDVGCTGQIPEWILRSVFTQLLPHISDADFRRLVEASGASCSDGVIDYDIFAKFLVE